MSLRHLNYEDEDDDGPSTYGTPFPPSLDDTNAPKKAEVDQTVRDEQGRRRFHGAFTGGFSAGYYNTVGSKEGWVPAQFKSGRQSGKWSRDLVKGKPEDFMDEEDLNIFGTAPRTVQTSDQFSGDVSRAVFAGFRDPSLSTKSLSQVLEDVIKPVKMTIGIKLYKKMKRTNTKKPETEVTESRSSEDQTSSRVYGCFLPPGMSLPDSDDEEDESTTIESFVLPFEPKNDFHGMGYKGINKDNPLLDAASSSISGTFGGRKVKMSGEAFGVGALSDEEDLDEDAVVYGNDDLNNYDFEIGSAPKKQTKAKKTDHLLQLMDSCKLTDLFESEDVMSKSKQVKTSLRSKYRLPELPRHFHPRPPWTLVAPSSDRKEKRSRWDLGPEDGKKSNRDDSDRWSSSQERGSSRSSREMVGSREQREPVKRTVPVMDANVRALLLGEEVIKVSPRRESEGHRLHDDELLPPPPSVPRESEKKLVIIRPSVFNIQEESPSVIAQPSPLFGYFASKFTHSSNEAEVGQTKLDPGLTLPTELLPSNKDSVKLEKDGSSNEEETKIGSCCRVSYQWHPHKLVSRRFNVPAAYPQFPDVVGVVAVGKHAENVRNRTSLVTQSSTSSSSSNRVPSSSTFVPSSSSFSPSLLDHQESQQRAESISRKAVRTELEIDKSWIPKRSDERTVNEIPTEQNLKRSNDASLEIERRRGSLFQSQNEIAPLVPEASSVPISGFVTSARGDQLEGEEEEMKEEPRPPIDLFRAIFASDEEKDSDEDEKEDSQMGDKKEDEKEKDLMEKTSGKSRAIRDVENSERERKKRMNRDDDRLDWRKEEKEDSTSRHHHRRSRPCEEGDDSSRKNKGRDGSEEERKKRDSRSRRDEDEDERESRRKKKRSDGHYDRDPSRDGWDPLKETTRSDQTYELERKERGQRRDQTRDRRKEVKSRDGKNEESERGGRLKSGSEQREEEEEGGNDAYKSIVAFPSPPSQRSSLAIKSLGIESLSGSPFTGTSKLHSFLQPRVKELSSATCDTISVTNVTSSVEDARRNLNKQVKGGHQEKNRREGEIEEVEKGDTRTVERRGAMNGTGLNDRLSRAAKTSLSPFEKEEEREAGEDIAKEGRCLVSVSLATDIKSGPSSKGHLHNLTAESATVIGSNVSSKPVPSTSALIPGFNEANLCDEEEEGDGLYGPALPPLALDTTADSGHHVHLVSLNDHSLGHLVKQKLDGERRRKRATSDPVSSDEGEDEDGNVNGKKNRRIETAAAASPRDSDASRKRKKEKHKKKRKRDGEKKEIRKRSKKHRLKDERDEDDEGDEGRKGEKTESDFRSKKKRKKFKEEDGAEKDVKRRRKKKDSKKKKKKDKKSSTSSSDSSASSSSSSSDHERDGKNKLDEGDLKLLKLLKEGR